MIFGVLSVLAAAVLVGVDQLIKRWATVVLLPKTAMTLIPGVLELRYFLNDGMAFSMLAGKQKLLIAATSLMLLGVLWMLFARKLTPLERVAWTGRRHRQPDRSHRYRRGGRLHQRPVHELCHLQLR